MTLRSCMTPGTAGSVIAQLADRVDAEATQDGPGEGRQDVRRVLQRSGVRADRYDPGVPGTVQRTRHPAQDADPQGVPGRGSR